MINKDRIVPIQKIDLLSLYATIMNLLEYEAVTLPSLDVLGEFIVEADGVYLANQPVKTLDIAEGASDVAVYFIPDYNFKGITLAGEAVEAEVKADGVSLYAAMLKDGVITVEAYTPSIS